MKVIFQKRIFPAILCTCFILSSFVFSVTANTSSVQTFVPSSSNIFGYSAGQYSSGSLPFAYYLTDGPHTAVYRTSNSPTVTDALGSVSFPLIVPPSYRASISFTVYVGGNYYPHVMSTPDISIFTSDGVEYGDIMPTESGIQYPGRDYYGWSYTVFINNGYGSGPVQSAKILEYMDIGLQFDGRFTGNLYVGVTDITATLISVSSDNIDLPDQINDHNDTLFGSLLSGIGSFFSQLWSNVSSAISNVASNVWSFFSSTLNNIWTSVKGIASGVQSAFQWVYDHSIGPALSGISNLFSNIFGTGNETDAPEVSTPNEDNTYEIVNGDGMQQAINFAGNFGSYLLQFLAGFQVISVLFEHLFIRCPALMILVYASAGVGLFMFVLGLASSAISFGRSAYSRQLHSVSRRRYTPDSGKRR